MRRMILVIVLALTLGAAIPGSSAVAPQSVGAHAADCPVSVYAPYWHLGKIEGFATFSCHSARYRLVVYVCGGVNGNGYCKNGATASCGVLSCGELTKYTSCSAPYAGPYWIYIGAKLQSQNNLGQWSSEYWTFGPGAWFSPGC